MRFILKDTLVKKDKERNKLFKQMKLKKQISFNFRLFQEDSVRTKVSVPIFSETISKIYPIISKFSDDSNKTEPRH